VWGRQQQCHVRCRYGTCEERKVGPHPSKERRGWSDKTREGQRPVRYQWAERLLPFLFSLYQSWTQCPRFPHAHFPIPCPSLPPLSLIRMHFPRKLAYKPPVLTSRVRFIMQDLGRCRRRVLLGRDSDIPQIYAKSI
jgi:hypothetical protein